MTRQLVTVRRVKELLPIDGADRIELAKIDGWQCVVKKGDFKVGDEAIYFEIDSMLPTSDSRFAFLAKGKDVSYARVKTIRLKKALSQGLLMPVNSFPEVVRQIDESLSDLFGVKLYEPPLPTSGKQKGTFPTHLIPKTDQERIQNIPDVLVKKSSFLDYEITEKLDGTSCTIWSFTPTTCQNQYTSLEEAKNATIGVASRNWEMQKDDDNVYSKILKENDLVNKLWDLGRNIAIQGEIIGPGIQGNKYGLVNQEFYVFDIYDIDAKRYLMFYERWELAEKLGLKHVPVLAEELHKKFNWNKDNPSLNERGDSLTLENVLLLADGTSMLNPRVMREGLVFKAIDGSMSFKAISNEWLLKYE